MSYYGEAEAFQVREESLERFTAQRERTIDARFHVGDEATFWNQRENDTDWGRVVAVDDEDPRGIIYVIQSEQDGGRHVMYGGPELEAIR